MKKICFFSGDITRPGGTERVSITLANALANTGKYDVIFLSLTESGDKPFFDLNEKIDHFFLNDKWIDPGPGYLKLIPRLKTFLIKHEIDIIIDIDIVLDILSVKACKKLNTKIISWEHFHCAYEQSVFYRSFIQKHYTKKTDMIVTLTRTDMLDYMCIMKRKDRIKAIYNPINTDPEDARPAHFSREKAILTIGALKSVKGTDYLLTVAEKVLPSHPTWKWYVIGDGEDRDMMEKKLTESGLTDQLIMTGQIADITPYLENSMIYCLTSRSEGLPMSLLEAKAHSLAMVAFDIHTGPSEIIEEGINGFLITPYDTDVMADRLSLLMDAGELRSSFCANASYGIERFSLNTILGEWRQIFDTLTA